MKEAVENLFERYEDTFRRSLAGEIDMAEVASLYAPEFIAASPLGVRAGKNDEDFQQSMAQGYAYYRTIGTRDMQVRDVRLSAIDECHCVAHVAWTATYLRDDLPETAIDFEVHYLVQILNGAAKVFGWVSGDENAVLKQHGVL